MRDDRLLFHRLGSTIINHCYRDPAFIRLLLYSALEGHELAHMFFERQVMETSKFLRDYILARIKECASRKVDPLIASKAFLGMINHYALLRELFKKNPFHIPAESAVDGFVGGFLEGIRRHDR